MSVSDLSESELELIMLGFQPASIDWIDIPLAQAEIREQNIAVNL